MLRTEPSEQQTPLQRPSLREFRGSFNGLFAVLISGGLVTWLLITDGIRDIAFKLSFDLMPIYLREIGGLSRQMIGLLDGMFGIALVAASYPGGGADRPHEPKICGRNRHRYRGDLQARLWIGCRRLGICIFMDPPGRRGRPARSCLQYIDRSRSANPDSRHYLRPVGDKSGADIAPIPLDRQPALDADQPKSAVFYHGHPRQPGRDPSLV